MAVGRRRRVNVRKLRGILRPRLILIAIHVLHPVILLVVERAVVLFIRIGAFQGRVSGHSADERSIVVLLFSILPVAGVDCVQSSLPPPYKEEDQAGYEDDGGDGCHNRGY